MEDLSASSTVPSRFLEGIAARLNTWRPAPLTLARVWTVAALVMLAPLFPFLTLMRAVFIDEIHMAEYGRLFLDPHTSWSIFWVGDHGITPWYFIGGTIAELALRASSPSCIGARLIGMLGTFIASGILVAWLVRRRTLPTAALLLGLLFLFSPLLMAAYTAGRIDGWMICCAFGAGYLFASFASQPRPWRLFCAGCLLSLGFFVWPSIAMLLPLLGLELILANRAASRSLWQSFAITATGAGLVFVALGLVVWTRVPTVFSDMPKQLVVAGMAPTWTVGKLLMDIKMFISHLILRAPWNVPIVILAWRHRASRAALLLALIPIALMFATYLYGNRVTYIVPYTLIAFSGVFALSDRLRMPGLKTWGLLAAAVAAAFTYAAVVRPVLPWMHRATRTETLLYSAATKVAPRGATVCLHGSTIEFYLVGRSRDWRMYMLTPETLDQCDSIVVRPEDSNELIASLGSHGFERPRRLLADQVDDAPSWELHVYGYFRYGPYDVYSRSKVQPALELNR